MLTAVPNLGYFPMRLEANSGPACGLHMRYPATKRPNSPVRCLTGIGVMLFAFLAAASTGAAHSLKQLESELGDREKYFQAMDEAAPDFELLDADGGTLRLDDLRGQVIVLNFIYTTCPDVCPLHAERIAEVQAMVNQTPMRDQVRFISITTDPEADTPQALRDYGPAHGLDPANWVFATSGPERPVATRRLAERYGLRFVKADDGTQTHAVVTHVIDSEGRWRAKFHGLGFDPANLVVFVNALVNDVDDRHAHPEPGFWDWLRSLF